MLLVILGSCAGLDRTHNYDCALLLTSSSDGTLLTSACPQDKAQSMVARQPTSTNAEQKTACRAVITPDAHKQTAGLLIITCLADMGVAGLQPASKDGAKTVRSCPKCEHRPAKQLTHFNLQLPYPQTSVKPRCSNGWPSRSCTAACSIEAAISQTARTRWLARQRARPR